MSWIPIDHFSSEKLHHKFISYIEKNITCEFSERQKAQLFDVPPE